MRVESQLVQQSLIDNSKAIENTKLTGNRLRESNIEEESLSFIPSPFGSSGTYSPSSLRAAVDYQAKFMTVAENNLTAVNHSGRIPQLLRDRLGSLQA